LRDLRNSFFRAHPSRIQSMQKRNKLPVNRIFINEILIRPTAPKPMEVPNLENEFVRRNEKPPRTRGEPPPQASISKDLNGVWKGYVRAPDQSADIDGGPSAKSMRPILLAKQSFNQKGLWRNAASSRKTKCPDRENNAVTQ